VVDVVSFFAEENAYCRGIVPNVNRIAVKLRDHGGTVCWVVPGYEPPSEVSREFLGDEIADMFANAASEGTPTDRLWKELDVAPIDLVFEKTATRAFLLGKCS
jgi:hypothetical protein